MGPVLILLRDPFPQKLVRKRRVYVSCFGMVKVHFILLLETSQITMDNIGCYHCNSIHHFIACRRQKNNCESVYQFQGWSEVCVHNVDLDDIITLCACHTRCTLIILGQKGSQFIRLIVGISSMIMWKLNKPDICQKT